MDIMNETQEGGPEIYRYVSVDIEASGPIPGDYSLLSIGACLVEDPSKQFYIELQPVSPNYNETALRVSGLNMESLALNGIDPKTAMQEFEIWLRQFENPIMVGYSATFDWMFIAYYFHHYLGTNPFGHNAIDIKALYMGTTGCDWKESSKKPIAIDLGVEIRNTHNALEDSVEQAKLFRTLLQWLKI